MAFALLASHTFDCNKKGRDSPRPTFDCRRALLSTVVLAAKQRSTEYPA